MLTYPRELGVSRTLWLADAIRPAGDVSMFAATTGTGTPRAGLHGELLLVRASVEAEIGWDFGPRTVVEDARFALEFARRHPGRSDWFPGRCFGATPATAAAFVVQRERWARGLIELALSRGACRCGTGCCSCTTSSSGRSSRCSTSASCWASGG